MPEDDDREQNPYERFDIDPIEGPGAITERMRELAEDAPDEATRKAVRAAWEELTLHPARRLRAAFGAHPDSHGAAGAPPPAPPKAAPPALELELADLALRPSVVDALGADPSDALPDLPLDRDPILGK
jgi:hypothetical protein